VNQKKIIRNTSFLYMRMLLSMFIGLYTSRVVLKNLGIEDYGIYNVIAGFVTMFSMLNFNLASQRFIAFALGQDDKERVQQITSSFNFINIVIVILFLLVAESLGLWFFENKLVIPTSRMNAAFWTYQLAIISFIVLLYSSTYVSIIIAYEKMQAFAYISIVECILKLMVALLLTFYTNDKLIIYAIFLFIAQLICQSFYLIYCKYNIGIKVLSFVRDISLLKEILSFSSWLSLTGVVVMLSTQGLNILLNIFFGPVINAARGIAVQVQSSVQSFGYNFMQAVNPQIVKSYAKRDIKTVHKLFLLSSKFGFLLLLLISLPIFLEANFLLNLWLGEVPCFTIIFLRIVLIWVLVSILSTPCTIAIQATGKIKKYQLAETLFLTLIFLFSWILLKYGAPPESVFIVSLIVECILLCVRLIIVLPLLSLQFSLYFKNVLLKLLGVSLPLISLAIIFHLYHNGTFLSFAALVLYILILMPILTYWVGCSKSERKIVNEYTSNLINKWKK
jgi:O-antigen/teichoic acid export membrane protein